MVQKNIRFAIIVMLAVASNSCTNINENQLPGVYVSNFEDYSDTILVNSNHTYLYKQYYNKSLNTLKGIWKTKNGIMTFENFSFHNSQNNPLGNWNAEIKIVDHEVRIIYADQEGYYYRKIQSR